MEVRQYRKICPKDQNEMDERASGAMKVRILAEGPFDFGRASSTQVGLAIHVALRQKGNRDAKAGAFYVS